MAKNVTSEYCSAAVFVTEVNDVQDLKQWTDNEYEMIGMTTEIFQQVRQLLFKCATSSIDAHARYFGHFQEAIT